MKRRHFIGALATGGLGTALAREASFAGKSPLVRTPLVLMAPRADGLEAVWAVSRLSCGRIECEAEDGTKQLAGADAFGFVPQGENILRVRLTGLKPGTAYRLRAHTIAAGDQETVTSPWKTFRTLDPVAAETRFVMWNDTHVHDESIRALHEKTPAADFLLWNGDTCNDWIQEELLVPTLLHPGGCDITERQPLFIAWGNHDVRGAHAFKMPDMVATPEGRPFHAFRSGPVAAICLHTGEDKPDDHPSFEGRVAFDALRAEQAHWLAATIRRPELRDAPYRLVFCHIPLRWTDERTQDYSASGYDRHSGRSRAAWHNSLVEWKTQVILSGHTHRSAWLPPTAEFPYGQLTGGGPRLPQATWTEGVADARQLRLKVTNLDGQILQEITLKPLT
jgi:hypothetical protein